MLFETVDLFYVNFFLKNIFSRVWDKWTFSDKSSFLMPDVSRIFRRPLEGNRMNPTYVETLFNQKRKTSLWVLQRTN